MRRPSLALRWRTRFATQKGSEVAAAPFDQGAELLCARRPGHSGQEIVRRECSTRHKRHRKSLPRIAQVALRRHTLNRRAASQRPPPRVGASGKAASSVLKKEDFCSASKKIFLHRSSPIVLMHEGRSLLNPRLSRPVFSFQRLDSRRLPACPQGAFRSIRTGTRHADTHQEFRSRSLERTHSRSN